MTPSQTARIIPLLTFALTMTAHAADVPPIVFVSRAFDEVPSRDGRTRAVELARSGRLAILEGQAVRVIVGGGEAGVAIRDVSDPDVSGDATRILFSGYSVAEDGWRIFEIDADGDGLRQITHSDREVDLDRYGDAAAVLRGHDDVDPCYLPDGRICFVSTRFVGVARDGRHRTTNLYVVNADGSDLHRITSERFGADTPVVEPASGRIVYSRFWRTVDVSTGGDQAEQIEPGSPGYENIVFEPSEAPLRSIPDEEFPGVNHWFLAGINPDGTGLSMWTGLRLDRELTQAYRPSFLPSGEALSVFLPVTPFIGFPRGYGLRRYKRGPIPPTPLGGPQLFPRRHGLPPRVNFLYASAEPLPDGRLLVSAVSAEGLDEGDVPNYALFVQENAAVEPVLLHDEPGTLELDAMPLVARAKPPVIDDVITESMGDESALSVEEAYEIGGSFTFLCENIFFNAPTDFDIANAPPVGRGLSIDFYFNSQRTSATGGDRPLLIRTIAIPPGGRIETTLPAGVPLFEVLRRKDRTIAVGRDGQIFHVAGANFGRVGGTARCVGCHAGHSQLEVPEDSRWTNLAPGAYVRASSTRRFGRLNVRDFAATNLVDRRTGTPTVEWASEAGEATVTADLRWTTALRGREVAIFGASPGIGPIGPRDQDIRRVTVSTRLGAEERQRVEALDVAPGGTRVALDSALTFDRLVIEIDSSDVSGVYEGREGVAIAEIEVLALDTGELGPAFQRGDVTNDATIDIADALATLNAVFGLMPPPCEAAADVDDNDRVNITDGIYLLNFLFRDGPSPGDPFSTCEPAPSESLGCGESLCR